MAANTTVWPKLPTRVMGAGGPIKIRQLKKLKHKDGTICWGTWDDSTRTIRIDGTAPPEHRWRVYFHEWTHAAIDDSGIGNLLADGAIETLCDAVATARLQEMRHQLLTP